MIVIDPVCFVSNRKSVLKPPKTTSGGVSLKPGSSNGPPAGMKYVKAALPVKSSGPDTGSDRPSGGFEYVKAKNTRDASTQVCPETMSSATRNNNRCGIGNGVDVSVGPTQKLDGRRKRRVQRAPRTCYTDAQTSRLKEIFAETPFISKEGSRGRGNGAGACVHRHLVQEPQTKTQKVAEVWSKHNTR